MTLKSYSDQREKPDPSVAELAFDRSLSSCGHLLQGTGEQLTTEIDIFWSALPVGVTGHQ